MRNRPKTPPFAYLHALAALSGFSQNQVHCPTPLRVPLLPSEVFRQLLAAGLLDGRGNRTADRTTEPRRVTGIEPNSEPSPPVGLEPLGPSAQWSAVEKTARTGPEGAGRLAVGLSTPCPVRPRPVPSRRVRRKRSRPFRRFGVAKAPVVFGRSIREGPEGIDGSGGPDDWRPRPGSGRRG